MSSNILKISEAASLALHAMIILSKNQNRLISVKEISSQLDISANHLSKVMQRLCKSGYIDSIKGYNGGFKIIVKPEDVSLLEIYELFDGKLSNSRCLLSNNDCGSDCILGDLVASIIMQVKEKFEQTKLSDFVK